MKRFLALLIPVCLSISATAITYNHEDSLRSYYYYVHKAEHQVITKDYANAQISYDSAFMYSRHPFSTDVYNKFLSCILTSDFKAASDQAEILIKHGASLKLFSGARFKAFRETAQFREVAANYSKWHEEYLRNTNQHLVRTIKMLIDADQAVHCLLPSLYSDSAFVARMRENDDSLSDVLTKLLLENDFLSEEVIGFHYAGDTSLWTQPLYGLIVLHQIQKGGARFNNILYQAMKQGKLRSEVLLSWLSQSGKIYVEPMTKYAMYNDTLWAFRLSSTGPSAGLATWAIEQKRKSDVLLNDYYLLDGYFDFEERMRFNYLNYCKTCIHDDSARAFRIYPGLTILGNRIAGSDGRVKSMSETYDVGATSVRNVTVVLPVDDVEPSVLRFGGKQGKVQAGNFFVYLEVHQSAVFNNRTNSV